MSLLTQQNLLEEEILSQERVTVERIKVPGIEVLHTRNKEDIANVLATIIKSRSNITGLNYVFGKYIEITLG